MEKILEILKQLQPGVDFETERNLVDKKILDSLAIVDLVSSIEEEYNIEIPVEEFSVNNFQSLESILSLVERVVKG